MFVYNCKVRLAGSLLNEVMKTGVTAPEIMLFQAFHGSDAVVAIEEAGIIQRSDDDERERLQRTYMGGSNSEEGLRAKQAMWMNLFGHQTNPLPTKLKGEIPKAPAPPKPAVDSRSKRQIMRESKDAETAPAAESVMA
jgi:hypothetical protein